MDRRTFIKQGGLAGTALAGALIGIGRACAQAEMTLVPRLIETPALTIAYEENGHEAGFPIFLLHGFPDDVRAWDDVTPPLVKGGYRVLVPYLRGYGPTRFRDAAAPRMAEQAAIGQDLIDFADALHIERFAVAGYDWGGRAASIAAALHPDRVRAAVLIGGNTIQDTVSPPNRITRKPSALFGISGISIPNAGAPGLPRTGAASAVCCGKLGRPTGASATRRSTGPQSHSTTPILWMW